MHTFRVCFRLGLVCTVVIISGIIYSRRWYVPVLIALHTYVYTTIQKSVVGKIF